LADLENEKQKENGFYGEMYDKYTVEFIAKLEGIIKFSFSEF